MRTLPPNGLSGRSRCHPLVVGQGTSLFMSLQGRRALVLRSVEQREAGRVYLTYAVEPAG